MSASFMFVRPGRPCVKPAPSLPAGVSPLHVRPSCPQPPHRPSTYSAPCSSLPPRFLPLPIHRPWTPVRRTYSAGRATPCPSLLARAIPLRACPTAWTAACPATGGTAAASRGRSCRMAACSGWGSSRRAASLQVHHECPRAMRAYRPTALRQLATRPLATSSWCVGMRTAPPSSLVVGHTGCTRTGKAAISTGFICSIAHHSHCTRPSAASPACPSSPATASHIHLHNRQTCPAGLVPVRLALPRQSDSYAPSAASAAFQSRAGAPPARQQWC